MVNCWEGEIIINQLSSVLQRSFYNWNANVLPILILIMLYVVNSLK